jgi:NADP-dependent 3-hydroxy acid dehydrogenase YdfG
MDIDLSPQVVAITGASSGPGAVSTELISHNRDEIKEAIQSRIAEVRPMQPQDIANAIIYALGQPCYVSINEVLVRPTRQVR